MRSQGLICRAELQGPCSGGRQRQLWRQRGMAGAGRHLQLRARLHSASIVVQLFSCVRLLATPGAAARQTSLSITNSPSLLKLTSNESLMPSKHFLLCRPLLLLPSVFPSIRVSSNEPGLHIRWPNDWSFSFSISPSSGHSGLIPFRMDLLAVPGTLKSLLVSVGWCFWMCWFQNT